MFWVYVGLSVFSALYFVVCLIALNHFMWWPRPADYIIGPPDNPQVLRWWVIPRNPIFNIYLHKFCRSDTDEALHDHPWCNMSLLLIGEYMEIVPEETRLRPLAGNLRSILRQPFRPVFRRAKSPHRVMLFTHGINNNIPYPVWSLFFTGPNLRTWGFHCPQGWIPWQQFVERYEGGNTKGKGCD
jgi:hypothetical protein